MGGSISLEASDNAKMYVVNEFAKNGNLTVEEVA